MSTIAAERPALDPSPTHSSVENADDTMLAFERGTLEPAQVSHRVHLSLAWQYLQRDGFPEGAQQFRHHLQRYVAKVRAQSKYHETITWAYLVLLNEEQCLRSPPGESFESMIQRRPDLLDHRNGPIARCYSKAQLESPEARRVFMFPTNMAISERSAS